MSYFKYVGLLDETGVPYGVKHIQNRPRVSSVPYTYDIGKGNISGHYAWSKVGYTPAMTTSESDIWSAGGVYVFPTTAMQMEVVSSSTSDAGTTIFSGTSTGGSTTTLVDTTKDFTAGTPVAVGDVIILDKIEYGIVTQVATTTLTVTGFSLGGSGASRTYAVVDKSASTGAQAIRVCYIDGTTRNEACEIVITNGTSAVATTSTNMYRINSFRVIAAGSGNKTAGNLIIRGISGGTTYSYITTGYTRARNVMYTVPVDYTLYVTAVEFSFGYAANQTHYARLYTRANLAPFNIVNTGDIFYSYTEAIVANSIIQIDIPTPTALIGGTDIKVSGVSSTTGIASCTLRGWLE